MVWKMLIESGKVNFFEKVLTGSGEVCVTGNLHAGLYSCLRAKIGHQFWNSYHEPIKSIVFVLFEILR